MIVSSLLGLSRMTEPSIEETILFIASVYAGVEVAEISGGAIHCIRFSDA